MYNKNTDQTWTGPLDERHQTWQWIVITNYCVTTEAGKQQRGSGDAPGLGTGETPV